MSNNEENYIQLPKSGQVTDEFARKEDRKKAYQIFAFAAIGSVLLTGAMYALTFVF